MPSQRITIEQLKLYMQEIIQSIPTSATVEDVPEDQKWIIETGFNHSAARWGRHDAIRRNQYTTATTDPTANATESTAAE